MKIPHKFALLSLLVTLKVDGTAATPSTIIVYVNDKGEECMFVAKIND